MVDEKEILKQYSYKATSNLVIEQDRRRRTATDSNVAALRVDSLPGRMGDKARAAKLGDELKSEATSQPSKPSQPVKVSRADIVDAVDELEIDDTEETYIPTTEVSRRAFEALLALVSAKLGDQPRDLLRSAASEAIATMKDEQYTHEKKREKLAEALGIKLSSEEFANITLYTDRMTDFETGVEGSRSDLGLTVLIEDEDDETTDRVTDQTADPEKERLKAELNQMSGTVDLDDVLNLDESLSEIKTETNRGVQVLGGADAAEAMLSKALGTQFSDDEKDRIIPDLIDAMQTSVDDQTCENRLLSVLGFDNVELVMDLMQRRDSFQLSGSPAPLPDSRPDQQPANFAVSSGDEKSAGQDPSNKRSRGSRKRPRSPNHQQANGRSHAEGGPLLSTVDIDALASYVHDTRSHSRDIKLPEGSKHIEGKDFQEWYIPPSRSSSDVQGNALVPVDRLPPWARPAFPGTARFNKMQSSTYDSAFASLENMLVCAPTGAGKTNVAMLATVKALENVLQGANGEGEATTAPLVVYIAPMKALVAEVVGNFTKRLEPLGVTVRELTGDVGLSAQELRRSHVVVSTPEKWDIVSRKGGVGSLSAAIQLLIIDEIHLLNDPRGPVLESIVARSRRSFIPNRAKTRILGLSATLPNYRDVAEFLDVRESKGLFAFDATFRPCPLQQCFMGISHKKPLKRFQLQNSLAYERTLHQMQNSEQVIVFVHSRKETAATCEYFIQRAIEEEATDHFLKPGTASHEIIQTELSNVGSKDLREIMEYGLAIHHAGLTRSDRELVEALFEKGHIRVLLSTATLAWGVNLPAHAVIIKGTLVYSPEQGRWTDLSPMDVMQMMGRAGRPQFDTFGEGIIITAKSDVMYYLSVLNSNLPVESKMMSRLVDFLNAEVAAGSVSSIEDGADWLQYSYMHIRMLKSPHLYGVSAQEYASDPSLHIRRRNLVHSAALNLHRLGLIVYSEETHDLKATALGRIAADFYVSHNTMSTFAEGLKQNVTDVDLFRLVSISGEFEHIRVRDEEKLELSRLAERVPIPIRESLDEPSAKTNVLLQAYISKLSLEGLALRADMIHVSQNAARLTRALVLTAAALKQAVAFSKCQNLFKNVAKRQWSTQTPLRQFGSLISSDAIRRIERKDVPFERYYDLEVQALQDLAKDKDVGRKLHKFIHCLPRVHLEAAARPVSRSSLEVSLVLAPDFHFDRKLHRREEAFWISVEDGDSESLFYVGLHHLRPVSTRQQSMSFLVNLEAPQPNHYIVRCVSDTWIGPMTAVPISLRELLLPDKFEAFSKLPKKAHLSVSKAFGSISFSEDQDSANRQASSEMLEKAIICYQNQFSKFSPMVGHIFPSLCDSMENIVIATLPSREREICGELAITSLFCRNPTAIAVWVVARGSVSMQRTYNALERGVGRALGLNIAKLDSFEISSLHALQKAGTVIVARMDCWDQFSRKWRQKKERRVLTRIQLMVLDGIQVLSERKGEGAALEALVSRTRYVAATSGSQTPLRIVALSDPVPNAGSIGQWLGAPPSFVFSFNPKALVTHKKLEVLPVFRRAGDYEPPALIRSLNIVLRRKLWGPDEQAIIFVPSRVLAQSLAKEIASTGGLDSLLIGHTLPKKRKTDTMDIPGQINLDRKVRAVYADAEMSLDKRLTIEEAFTKKEYDVLVSTPDYAWITSLSLSLVVIAGTKRLDNVESCSSDELERTDVLQMAYRLQRSDENERGHVLILTEEQTADQYRKLLEPLPLESRLPERFADHLNAVIASGVVETKQDAVDYLTWTFFCHRLPKNPNFYGLRGLAPDEVSRHLSELVELALADLEGSKCVAVEGEEDVALGALNLGIIASHYYIRHETVEFFAASVNPRVKVRSILDIISFAWEFRHIEVRRSELDALSNIASKVPLTVDPELDDLMSSISSRHKVHLLIQAHLSRIDVGPDMRSEQRMIVITSIRLLRAFVDVIASAGWLKPALVAVDLSQMLLQGVWDLEIPLLQLPHMDIGLAKTLKDKYNVSDVFEFLDMEQDQRTTALMGFTNEQLREVASACNSYPNLEDIEVGTPDIQELEDGTKMTRLTVLVSRSEDTEEETDVQSNEVPLVVAPRFPGTKVEGWWIILGNPAKNTLLTLKYFNLRQKSSVKLNYATESDSNKDSKDEEVQVYLVSDSYIDCDQNETITFS